MQYKLGNGSSAFIFIFIFILKVRIENDSLIRTEKVNIFQSFLETNFVHISCYPDHYEPKTFLIFLKSAETMYYLVLEKHSVHKTES